MKKGFTLIELLAVIIILGVIALIATPVVLKVVDNAKVSAFKNTAYGLIDAGGFDYKDSILNGVYSGIYVEFLDGEIISSDTITVSGQLPDSGDMQVNSKGEVEIAVYSNTLGICAYKKYTDSKITAEEMDAEDCNISNLGGVIVDEDATDASCFTYEDYITYDYDIDSGNCVNYFINEIGWYENEDDLGEYCNHGEDSSGNTLDYAINNGWVTANDLISNNVISNFETQVAGARITGYTCGGYYDINNNVIDGSEMNPVIPSKIDNKNVVSIGEYSFSYLPPVGYNNNNNDEIIILSNNLKEIKPTFLANDSSSNVFIYSISIPNTVKEIDGYAFYYNKLTSVTFGNGLRSIGQYAFGGNQLTNVTIPEGVTSIENLAFNNNQLTTVIIPNSVTKIGNYAFQYNYILQGSVTIDNTSGSVSIGSYAFDNNGSSQTTTITPVYLR